MSASSESVVSTHPGSKIRLFDVENLYYMYEELLFEYDNNIALVVEYNSLLIECMEFASGLVSRNNIRSATSVWTFQEFGLPTERSFEMMQRLVGLTDDYFFNLLGERLNYANHEWKLGGSGTIGIREI